jgi:hypothetical protein
MQFSKNRIIPSKMAAVRSPEQSLSEEGISTTAAFESLAENCVMVYLPFDDEPCIFILYHIK